MFYKIAIPTISRLFICQSFFDSKLILQLILQVGLNLNFRHQPPKQKTPIDFPFYTSFLIHTATISNKKLKESETMVIISETSIFQKT